MFHELVAPFLAACPMGAVIQYDTLQEVPA